MMANVDIWVSNQVTLRFGWWQVSQSIANNNSVVGWHLQLVTTGGSISSSASKSWNVTVNGSNYSGTCTIGVGTNATKTLASGSTTIAHNADGTKSFGFSFSLQFDINYSGVGWIGTKSGSGSGTLSTIPRTSSVSSTNANIGENITITINRASSSFTHTLTYKFHSLTGTIATKTNSTSVSWTLPTTFYAQIPNSKSSWGTIICDTYSGSTKIGSSTCRFDVYVKESTNKPGISATVVDVNDTTKALTGDENKLIKYYSRVKFSITSSPKNNAGTKSIDINYNGNWLSGGSGNSWTDYFSNVVSGKYICSVTDTRGLFNSVTFNKTLINYIKLSCAITVSNPTASGECTLTIKGNYFNGSFGATSNTLTVQYKKDSGSWTNATATKSGNTYTATVKLTGLDYTQAYTFQARAIDKLATVTTAEKRVKATPIFDWGSDDFHFHVPIYMKDNKPIYGYDPKGNLRKLIAISDGNTDVGDADYSLALCSTNAPIWWNGSKGYTLYNVTNHGCKRLAQGAWHMNSSHSIGLSDTIWNQSHGIILVFSAFNPSSGETYQFDWHTYFVPKSFYTDRESAEGYALITIFLTNPTLSNIGTKHLRVYNNKITGDDRNIQRGSGSGISFKNNEWVLRYVYGI